MSKLDIVKKNINLITGHNAFRAKFIYTRYYEKLLLDSRSILIESNEGYELGSGIYNIIVELCLNKEFLSYKKFLSVQKGQMERIESFLYSKKIKDIVIVEHDSKEYCKLLATAKYLINDLDFPVYYIKKEGQIYLNIGRGTSIKGIGREMKKGANSIGSIQRNILMADYLICHNDYIKRRIINNYMIGPFFKGNYVVAGSLYNSAFFERHKKNEIKKRLGIIENKKVIVYMPTWRKDTQSSHKKMIEELLYKLDSINNGHNVIYVKLHWKDNFRIDLSKHKDVHIFPDEYDTYEILNISDCLITDYSSVAIDYFNANRKVILYAYDLETYDKEHGIGIDIKSLPFEITYSSEEVCAALETLDDFDPSAYLNERSKYCYYDNKDSVAQICRLVFKDEHIQNGKVEDGSTYHNDKKNLYFFTGRLARNGITTALKGLLKGIDKEKYNCVISFRKRGTEKKQDVISEFGDDIYWLPIRGKKNATYLEAICQYIYFNLNISKGIIAKIIKKSYDREVKRLYPSIIFDTAINYTGYDERNMHLIAAMDTRRIVYAHNDIFAELATKKNIHFNTLKMCYQTYDTIVTVRESMHEELLSNASWLDTNRIKCAHNLNDIVAITEKAELEAEFQTETYCNYSIEEVRIILNDDSITKFIDIARFAKEKGLDNLIKAFTEYNKDKNDWLIIIGGYGNQFEEIKSLIFDNDLENVIIIKNIANPYPILKKCHVFIMSSHYEGLPMTIMEALILGKPVVCTDIPGPREFLSKGYGVLIPDSVEGLITGFNAYCNGKLDALKPFNAEEFNENALNEFYKIL